MRYGDIVGGFTGKISDALVRLAWTKDEEDGREVAEQFEHQL
jgi:hypothetical protein